MFSAPDERTQHSDAYALSSRDGLSYIAQVHLRTAKERAPEVGASSFAGGSRSTTKRASCFRSQLEWRRALKDDRWRVTSC
jgi:hypothetical protein